MVRGGDRGALERLHLHGEGGVKKKRRTKERKRRGDRRGYTKGIGGKEILKGREGVGGEERIGGVS